MCVQSSERTIRLDAGMFTPQTSDGQEWRLILASLLTRLTRIRQPVRRATMTAPVSLAVHSSKSCRWVVFDAVGTLMEPDPTVAVAYHRVGAKYGSRLSVADVGARFRRAFRASETDSFPGGPEPGERWRTSDSFEEERWRWIVREVFPEVRDQEGCFRELWDHFARPASWRCGGCSAVPVGNGVPTRNRHQF